MRTTETRGRPETAPLHEALSGATGKDAPAWELLEAGRYRPRRIRGSFRGRELG